MKLFKIMFFITATLILFPLQVFSHPPKNIDLMFNTETKILQVIVQHEVKNPENHYIKKIEVFLNDKLRIVQNFEKQESKMSQNATYFLFDAKEGDKIKVTASCSVFGSKTSEIAVKQTTKEE